MPLCWDFRTRQSAVGTTHFEPGGVSFQHEGRQKMARNIVDPRWQPKPLWTARRLAELSNDVGKLRRKIRVTEAILSKASSSRARKSPGHVPRH